MKKKKICNTTTTAELQTPDFGQVLTYRMLWVKHVASTIKYETFYL